MKSTFRVLTSRSTLRTLIIFAILIGGYLSITTDRRLRELRSERNDLHDIVRPLDVKDPSKIYIGGMKTEIDSSGVDQGIQAVWKFRVYYPGNCDIDVVSRYGRISADSPRAHSSGASSSSAHWGNEPKSGLLTVSIEKTETGWLLHRLTDSGSGSSRVRTAQHIADLDGFVIEPIVRPEDASKAFSTDEPICVLRLRSKQPTKERVPKSEVPLYDGIYMYLVPDKAKEKFERQVAGTKSG